MDISQPLPEKLSVTELYLTTRRSWEACLADFYRDDWTRMADHTTRMGELANRWKAEKPPENLANEFNAATAGFEAAVAELKKNVEEKNVNGVTEAMRALGKRIDAFEAMRQTPPPK